MHNEAGGYCVTCGRYVPAGEGLGYGYEGVKVMGGVTPITTGYGLRASREYREDYTRHGGETVCCLGCATPEMLAAHKADEDARDADWQQYAAQHPEVAALQAEYDAERAAIVAEVATAAMQHAAAIEEQHIIDGEANTERYARLWRAMLRARREEAE